MNRIVFVVFVLLGMSLGPQAQATNLPLFQKAFLILSIEIANVVVPDGGSLFSGTCTKQLPAHSELGANHVHSLNQPPFDVYIDGAGACDSPMNFNYINLIVTGGNLAQARLELGYIDPSNLVETRQAFVNVACTTKNNPSDAADRTELDCQLAPGNGSGIVTFAAQD